MTAIESRTGARVGHLALVKAGTNSVRPTQVRSTASTFARPIFHGLRWPWRESQPKAPSLKTKTQIRGLHTHRHTHTHTRLPQGEAKKAKARTNVHVRAQQGQKNEDMKRKQDWTKMYVVAMKRNPPHCQTWAT